MITVMITTITLTRIKTSKKMGKLINILRIYHILTDLHNTTVQYSYSSYSESFN